MAEGNSKEHKTGRTEYARLDLLAPITLANGVEAKEIVIFRPNCKQMTEIMDTARLNVQVERFVEGCCLAINGSGEPSPFNGNKLISVDGAELSSIIGAMSLDAERVTIQDSGDGISTPYIYNLQHPIKLTPADDSEVIHQFEFQAKSVGDITEYLDAAGRGETREFHTFMRTFARPIGIRIPITTDILINALDFLDYLVIRRNVLPKFINSRNRWRRA